MKKKMQYVIVSFILSTTSLFSLNGDFTESNNSPYSLNLLLDSTILSLSVGINGSSIYLDKIKELNKRSSENEVFNISDINSLDRLIVKSYSKELDSLSTYLGVASMITPVVLISANSEEWLTIGTMYLETITLAYGLKEIGKIFSNRARPYKYLNNLSLTDIEEYDWNKSFPSGHTTLAFAGASFTHTVFKEYFPDSKLKYPVIVTSYLLATTTATLRVLSGNHFLTDVLAGAATGMACGFFIPWTHKLEFFNSKSISIKSNLNGIYLSLNI